MLFGYNSPVSSGVSWDCPITFVLGAFMTHLFLVYCVMEGNRHVEGGPGFDVVSFCLKSVGVAGRKGT